MAWALEGHGREWTYSRLYPANAVQSVGKSVGKKPTVGGDE
jgi:hypothetical protein